MIDKLRELHSKATPGPWAVRKEEYDSHEAMTADTGKTYARGGHVLHYLAVAGAFPAFTGNGPTSKANAEYLAAVHDALPALLNIIEKAQAAYDALADLHVAHHPEEPMGSWVAELRDLGNALATDGE